MAEAIQQRWPIPSFVRLVATSLMLALLGHAELALAAPGDNRLVSVDGISGAAAGESSGRVAISGYGRHVLFGSTATTLVPGDTNNQPDVFVRDLDSGLTERISIGFGGVEANGPSWPISVSRDGRYVAFESSADNITADDGNVRIDAFIHDRQTGLTARITRSSNFDWCCWTQSGGVSDDGRFAPFNAGGGIFVRDIVAGVTISLGGAGSEPVISGNGRYVLFRTTWWKIVPGDTEGTNDLFIWDRYTRLTQRITVQGPERLWNNDFHPSISTDGRWVTFTSYAKETPDDLNDYPDAFLWDRLTGQTRLVSVSADGAQSNGMTFASSVSDDGRYVAFSTNATNLSASQTIGGLTVFLKDMQTGAIERAASDAVGWNQNSLLLELSNDGRFVAFNTSVSMTSEDRNLTHDTYVHQAGASTVDPGAYEIYLRPLSIEYGEVAIGTSLKKGFMLTNAGAAPLPISTIELLGVHRSQYVLRSFCGSTLPVGSRCWISVWFSPTSLGYKQANLHVVAGGINRHRALRGTGIN